jgi:LDH2 family malate/lactate/ureidoglycolate dehydrogenase
MYGLYARAVEKEEALSRLRALGLAGEDVDTLFAHFDAAERAGKEGHGHSRIPWLETQEFDPAARPVRLEQSESFERWSGNGGLGYLTMASICRATLAAPPVSSRLVVAERCFPTGSLGYWARSLATGGLIALVTATSPRRLPAPTGGRPLTGTNPLAIGIPSSEGRPLVADVSMGAVTHGDVIAGRATPEELVPFGGALAHKAFALAVGLELFVSALAGDEHGAVILVAQPRHDPVSAFRELASGVRLPGDR